MAKNVELMGAVFPDCPAVMLPTHEGPLARFTDVSDSQAVAADVAQGKQFYLADGTKATGTNQGGGGGGGGGTIKPNAKLVLIDYDGSIVDSYTKSEVDALSALPDAPDHSGDEIPLTSQGWNWTLTEVREQLAAMPEQTVYVGQMYVPTDGKTHLLIYIDPETPSARRDMIIRVGSSVLGGVTIGWGDGNTTTTANTQQTDYGHTYDGTGWFDITLTATDGTIILGGTNNSSSGTRYYSIFGTRAMTDTTHCVYLRARIRHAFIGQGITDLTYGSFCMCHCLETITLPNGLISAGNNAMYSCHELKCVIFPRGVTKINSAIIQGDIGLRSVSLPYTVTNITNNAFYGCSNLTNVCIPDLVSAFGSGIFQGCWNLPSITIPDRITVLSSYVFYQCNNIQRIRFPASTTELGANIAQNCYSITSVTIPKNVTVLQGNCFQNCYSLRECHIKPTTPPVLSGANNFSGIGSDCVFYVPYSEDHSILAAYQSASNWSTYASRMVEEAE